MDGRCTASRDHHAHRARASAGTAGADPGRAEAAPEASTRRYPRADLLQRVFEVDALCCPRCGGRMRVLAAITEPGPPSAGRTDALWSAFELDQSTPAEWDVGA